MPRGLMCELKNKIAVWQGYTLKLLLGHRRAGLIRRRGLALADD